MELDVTDFVGAFRYEGSRLLSRDGKPVSLRQLNQIKRTLLLREVEHRRRLPILRRIYGGEGGGGGGGGFGGF